MEKLIVSEIVNGNHAILLEDGDKVFKKICEELKTKNSVELDFSGLSYVTSGFLNSAIGNLYSLYEESFIKEKLTITSASERDLLLLSRIVERAKEYFADEKGVSKALDTVFAE